MISFRRAVLVVARRELRERLRDRAVLWSIAVSVLILAAIIVLPSALGAGDDPKATVVVSDPAGQTLAEAARAGQERFEVRLEIERAADDGAARAQVRDDDADLAIVDGGRRLVRADGGQERALNAVQAASAQLRAERALTAAGVDPASVGAALAPPPLPTTQTGEDEGPARATAYIALLVLFGQIVGLGYWLAAGVVEEKSSRIVELVLSAIPARAILAGKVLGLGLVGLLQVLVIGLVGVALAAATGQVDIGGSGIVGALLITLAWFLLGYALYACAFAMAGALVARPDEVQNATTPVSIVLFAGFFLSFSALEDPGGGLATVLSVLPPTAPLVMPIRMITGDAAALEVVAAVALLVATTTALVVLAGRVYAGAVLRTGGRVRLRAALRGERVD